MEGLRLSSKNLPAKVGDMAWEEPLEKEMATHCSILAWEFPRTEEPGTLPSTRSQSQTWLSDRKTTKAKIGRKGMEHLPLRIKWFSTGISTLAFPGCVTSLKSHLNFLRLIYSSVIKV